MRIENLMRKSNEEQVPVDAVLMAYDIVKYTSYCDFHESRGNHGRVHELIQTVTKKGNDIIKEFGGYPNTFTGDGFISSFEGNASEKAIDAAFRLHEMAKGVRRDFDGGHNPRLKVSLYRGQILFAYMDSKIRPIGRAPCKLSRIGDFVEPEEILASGSVMDPVMDFYDVEKREGIHLRGIFEQKRVYKVVGKKNLN